MQNKLILLTTIALLATSLPLASGQEDGGPWDPSCTPTAHASVLIALTTQGTLTPLDGSEGTITEYSCWSNGYSYTICTLFSRSVALTMQTGSLVHPNEVHGTILDGRWVHPELSKSVCGASNSGALVQASGVMEGGTWQLHVSPYL